MTDHMHPADAAIWLERAAHEATPHDTGRLRQANNIERFPMKNDRTPVSPLAGLGSLGLFLAMILAFAFGVAAFFKFVM